MRLWILVCSAAALLLAPAAAQAQTTTTTALSSAPTSPEVNQPVTLTATVTSGTGTVVFLDGNTTITGCGAQPLDATGTATCQTGFSTLGSHDLTAAYIPDTNAFAPSSGFLPLTVRSPSVAVLYPASAVVGQPVTYSVVVAPGWSDPTVPTGAVQFLDSGVPIGTCSNQPLSPSAAFATASCTVTYSSPGAHTITAIYGGDSGFVGASSNAQSVSVSPAPTTTTLTSSTASPVTGEAVTFTATVSPSAGPTGTVAFADNGTAIAGCAAQPVSGGAAGCTVSYAAAVAHTITATYRGDANFEPSSASPVTIAVSSAPSPAIEATTLKASAVTTTGAVFTGRLTAAGTPLGWQFEYGTRAPLTKATALRTVPAGHGSVGVSARVQALMPATTYTFQIVAFATGNGASDTAFGQEVSFTTKPLGQVLLSFGRLHAGAGSFPLRVACTYSAPCLGRVTIVATRAACGVSRYRVPGRSARIVTVRLASACRTLLRRTAQLRAQITATPSTPQLPVTRPAVLTRR